LRDQEIPDFTWDESSNRGSLANSALNGLPMPEMHMRMPKAVLSEDVSGGSFQNTVSTAIAALSRSSISD